MQERSTLLSGTVLITKHVRSTYILSRSGPLT